VIKKNRLFIYVFSLFSFLLLGQEIKEDKKPLTEVLSVLQVRYSVNFSYADKNIENIKVLLPMPQLTLEEALNSISNTSQLKFTILSSSLVTINKKPTSFIFCGVLKDRFSLLPIEGATIIAANTYTTTGTEGNFELTVSMENERITISSLGYKTITILGKDNSRQPCKTLFMTPFVEELNEVVLVNYLTQGITKNTSGVLEIDYSKFGILPGLIEADVLQTVQALPGIQSTDETVSNINIRGGTHDQNLILWDGIKMYQSGHFFGLISAFNPHLTNKVSLIKNGTSAAYTDGVSGTILMQSDTDLNDEFKGGIGFNLINIDALIDAPLSDKSSLQLSARRSINDIVQTPTYKQYFDKAFTDTEVSNGANRIINSDEGFSFYDVNLRLLHELTQKDKLRLNFINFDNRLVFKENAEIDGELVSRESSAQQNSLSVGLFYQRDWNPWLTTSLQLFGTNYNLKSTNNDIINDQRLLQENQVLESGTKFLLSYTPNEIISFKHGYNMLETGVTNTTDVNNPIIRRSIKEVIVTHAVFSEADYSSKSKNTHMSGGLRLSYLEKFDKFILEPRIRFNQRFLRNISLEVLAEMKHQTTSQVINFQNDFLGVENRRWLLSNNTSIPIIKSKQLSAGLQYTNKGWLLSAEGYVKNVTGITSQSQGFQNQFQFVKTTGSYRVRGIDFLINKKFANLSTWLSYSFANNIYTFDTFTPIMFPNNVDLRQTLTAATAYTMNNFKLSAGVNWHTGKPTTHLVSGNEVVDNELNFMPSNSSRLDNYIRIDLSATYKFDISKKVKGYTGIALWNIFNKNNTINTYYSLSDNGVENTEQTALGLTPNATFRINF
jgi:hypothetical protein